MCVMNFTFYTFPFPILMFLSNRSAVSNWMRNNDTANTDRRMNGKGGESGSDEENSGGTPAAADGASDEANNSVTPRARQKRRKRPRAIPSNGDAACPGVAVPLQEMNHQHQQTTSSSAAGAGARG